jgi:cell division protease FtsH
MSSSPEPRSAPPDQGGNGRRLWPGWPSAGARRGTDAQSAPKAPPPGSGTETPPPARRPRFPWLLALLIFVANYLLITWLLPDQKQRLEIPYTAFRAQVEAGNVAEVMSRGDIIQGTFKQPVTYPPQGSDARTSTEFSTVLPAFADPGLETVLRQQGVQINARPLEEPRSWWLNLLLSFGPTLLLIGVFVWLSQRAAGQMGGAFGLGRSSARRYDQATTERPITFEDVAGIEEAERELVEIVDFLKDPSRYTRLGGTAPKGVLLVGPPGTGKTLLARAVAGEAGVPFFSLGASEFVEMIVGVGAARVRDLFKQAREAAPAIIFIDELDAIGRARGGMVLGGANSEQEQTLNQILTEMDGFSSREGVIVLAATNRPDVLDPALLRPGRFDRRVIVQAPDRQGREAILRVHTRGVPLATDVDLEEAARATPGFVGADLRNLVNEAALMAARRGADAVHMKDFLDALEKLVLGPARDLLLSREERELVAYHEGGHTILGLVVPGADPVNRVTITPRGQALGVTYQRPEDDRHNLPESYLRARIIGALGGRAAEELVYGTRTTGSESDMEQATSLARQMVTRWGMSERLGPVTLAQREGGYLSQPEMLAGTPSRALSEETATLIDEEIRRILDEAYEEALRLLGSHRERLERLAATLLEKETLDEAEIRAVTGLAAPARSGIDRVAGARLASAGRAGGDGTSGDELPNQPAGAPQARARSETEP